MKIFVVKERFERAKKTYLLIKRNVNLALLQKYLKK